MTVIRPASLILSSSLLLLACDRGEPAAKAAERPPAPVEVYEVEPGPLVRTVDAVGTLRSAESVQVTTELAGKVTFVDIPEGKRVEKGHILARLDASAPAAELAVARARLEGAKDVLSRTKTLEQERLVARAQVDDAQSAREIAQSELARQRVTVQKTVIKAPFDGVIGIREISAGAYVVPGTPVTTLTNVDGLELVFTVPERHVARLQVGQPVRGVVGACTHRFSGQVTVLEPAVDPATRTLRALARVEDPSGALRPGMSASIKIEVDEEAKALKIPLEAVIRRGTQRLTYVVKDGKAERRTIRTGEIDLRSIEVVDGLEPGEQVITSGHQKVRPGSAVVPKPYEPVDNPNLSLGAASDEADCWF